MWNIYYRHAKFEEKFKKKIGTLKNISISKYVNLYIDVIDYLSIKDFSLVVSSELQ